MSALKIVRARLTLRHMSKQQIETSRIIAYRCPAALVSYAEQAAAREGLTVSDVARRALIRDRERDRREQEGRAA